MSLKNCLMLILVLALIFSILPLNAAAQETTEPTEAVQAPAEEEGIPWGFTALILALITTILQRIFIFNRR